MYCVYCRGTGYQWVRRPDADNHLITVDRVDCSYCGGTGGRDTTPTHSTPSRCSVLGCYCPPCECFRLREDVRFYKDRKERAEHERDDLTERVENLEWMITTILSTVASLFRKEDAQDKQIGDLQQQVNELSDERAAYEEDDAYRRSLEREMPFHFSLVDEPDNCDELITELDTGAYADGEECYDACPDPDCTFWMCKEQRKQANIDRQSAQAYIDITILTWLYGGS